MAASEIHQERSIGELLRELLDGTQDLLKSEAALAKREAQAGIERAKGGAVLLAAGGIVGAAALVMLEIAAFEALSTIWARWVSALVLALGTGLIALLLVARGKRRLEDVDAKPEQAIEEGKHTAREVRDRLQEGLG